MNWRIQTRSKHSEWTCFYSSLFLVSFHIALWNWVPHLDLYMTKTRQEKKRKTFTCKQVQAMSNTCLRRLWSENERCSYWSTLLWATIGEVLMRRLCRASRHALQFVCFVFFKKSTKWIAYLDFVTLSYIQTSDEGVQINILYEKNIGCHFEFFHHMHLLYHQLDILIYNSCNLEVKNRSII